MNDLLKKYASIFNNNVNIEAGMDEKTRHERELIRRAQNGDFMAKKELMSLYKGTINNAISSSGLNTVMDQATAQQEAIKAFNNLILKNFDLTSNNKPSTYIIGQLPNVLRGVKYNNRDFVARKSEELSMHSEVVATAKGFLKQELGRDATPDEIYNFVKNNLRTGKSLTVDKIKRIDALSRRELSGNAQIGGDKDGSDFLTLEDISNVSKVTPEELMNQNNKNAQIEEIIKTLSRNERRLIRNYYGLGEFKGKKNTNLNRTSINNNMTYYEAKKTIDKFREMLKSNGVIDI